MMETPPCNDMSVLGVTLSMSSNVADEMFIWEHLLFHPPFLFQKTLLSNLACPRMQLHQVCCLKTKDAQNKMDHFFRVWWFVAVTVIFDLWDMHAPRQKLQAF